MLSSENKEKMNEIMFMMELKLPFTGTDFLMKALEITVRL